MKAPHDAGLACACLRCGSTGGYVAAEGWRPSRTRGLCTNCASWHRDHDTIDQFPRLSGNHLVHPVIPRGYVSPAMLGCAPGEHAVLAGYDAAAVAEEALALARAWLDDPRRRARSVSWIWAQADETVAYLEFAHEHRKGAV